MNLTKKQTFILLGVGLVASGIVTILLIYQGLYNGDMFIYQPLTRETGGEDQEFNLEEIHSVPLARHDHVSISILVNGRPTVIPEGVGMESKLWHDRSLYRYGPSGISPMHTHDTLGTIHIESTVQREFTVGEFLSVMGLESEDVTRMNIDGNEVSDFVDHEMKNGERIQLEMTIPGQ